MYECGTFIVDSYVVGRINSIFREDSANCDISMKFVVDIHFTFLVQ